MEFAKRADAQMALALDDHQLSGCPIRMAKVARTGTHGGQQQPVAAGSRLRAPFSKGARPARSACTCTCWGMDP